MPIPNTKTAVFYAYDIIMNGRTIGTLSRFNSSFSKTVERIREVSISAGARVTDLVPGTTDISVDIEKFRLYRLSLYEALGYQIFSLEDFIDPFDIQEVMQHPDGKQETIIYHICLLSSYGKTVSTGSTMVAETATIQVSYVTGLGGNPVSTQGDSSTFQPAGT